MGNVPASLLSFGTPEQVEAHCKKLIEVVGEGGGFILANACSLPYDARVENVKAMIRASEKYGVY
jgi:uroporphyrinogen-III decarboxylase